MINKPPFWASFFTLCGIIILCTLGTWQLQRLSWKEQRLQTLENFYTQSNHPNLDQLLLDNVEHSDFIYGTINGEPLPEKAFFYGYAVKDGQAGHHLVMPVQSGLTIWLVHMGWTDQSLETLQAHFASEELQDIELTGLARKSTWNSMTPQNRPQDNLWYRLDHEQIKEHFELEKLAPLTLYAEKSSPDISNALPNNTRWQPNNNHAQYALFWFALAITLAVIYVLRFIRKAG